MAQCIEDSEEHFIAKKINNKNLQTKFNDIQTQLANVCTQRAARMANPTATKYERLQQYIENIQSQLDNTCVYQKDSMATTMDATIMAATWRPRGIGPIELLSGKIIDNYGLWSYAICKKLKTDTLMYVTEQQRMVYALSQIKSSFFNKIAAWVAENLDTIIMLGLFNKTKHWIGVHLQGTKAKQELITIVIKNNKSVSKYYYRIFKLWTRANTPIDKRIVKFTRSLKSSISMPLLGCKFTSIRAVLDETQDIKDAQKEITYTFPRQDNRQQSSSKFFCGSNSQSSATSRSSTADGSSTAGGSSAVGESSEKDRKPTVTKPARWSGMWYNLDLKPKKLENDNKIMLSH